MSTARKISEDYMRLIKHFALVPIRSKQQFKEAIVVMKELVSRVDDLSRDEEDYLSVLGDLIASYEKQLEPLGPKMTPVEALKYLMEVNGLTQADLIPFVGHKSNLSAFLHGKRGLSKANAVKLGQRFRVSPTLFLPSLDLPS